MDRFIGTTAAAVRQELTAPDHTLAAVKRIKHHYGACVAELARYARGRPTDAAAAVLMTCERRLDNVVRRAGFTPTRVAARRAVVHGHILVNGRKVNHPSYLVRAGDVLMIRPRPHIEAEYRRRPGTAGPPAPWIHVEPGRLRATIARLPAAGDVTLRVDGAGVAEFLTR